MQSPEHFKLIFSSNKNSSDNASPALFEHNNHDDFTDTKKEVPFIGDFEDNPSLMKLSPSFMRLDELYKQIKETQKHLKLVEGKKSASFFRRATESKRIG